jgi:hypothetical protein
MKVPNCFFREVSTFIFYFTPLTQTKVEKLCKNIAWKSSTFDDWKSCGYAIMSKNPNQKVSRLGVSLCKCVEVRLLPFCFLFESKDIELNTYIYGCVCHYSVVDTAFFSLHIARITRTPGKNSPPPNATTCPLWTSWSPLPAVAEV